MDDNVFAERGCRAVFGLMLAFDASTRKRPVYKLWNSIEKLRKRKWNFERSWGYRGDVENKEDRFSA